MPYRIQTTLIAAALLTFAGGVMAQTESVPPQTNPIQEILANPAKARKADPSSTEARVIRAADELNVKFSNALTEAVLKLQVNNSTTLEELPEVRTALDAYLESLRNNLPLSAEKDSLRISASLKVDIAKLADVLKPVSAKHHTGTRVRGSDFDMMPALNEKKTLTVSVTQWIPTKFADQPAYKINPETLKADYHLPKLWLENLQPRKVRAARALTRLAARRNGIDRLAVKLADVPIHVGSLKGEALTPRMLFGEKDDMHAVLKSLMRNTAITGIRYHHDVMVCEVEVQTSLKVAVANLKGWVETRGSKEAREHIPTLVKFVQNTKADHLDSMGIAAVSPLYVVPAYDRVQTAMVNLVAATPAWAFTTTSCSDGASKQGAIDKLAETLRSLPMLGSDNGAKTLGDFLTANAAAAPEMKADFDELILAFPAEHISFPEPGTHGHTFMATANLKDVWNFVLHYAPQLAEARAKAAEEAAKPEAPAVCVPPVTDEPKLEVKPEIKPEPAEPAEAPVEIPVVPAE